MKLKCSNNIPRFTFCLVFLGGTAVGMWKGNRYAARSAGLVSCHLSFHFFTWAISFDQQSQWQMIRSTEHTWAVSLLASGSAMTMRCKAWNCTLMWGPPNKKTEITTHLEHHWCILTAFLANIWWQRRFLTALDGKDLVFVPNNVNVFAWTDTSVCQLPFHIPWCHCQGMWPTRSSK